MSSIVRLVFSSVLHIWYVEVRISRSVSEGPFDFEITRVDCIRNNFGGKVCHVINVKKKIFRTHLKRIWYFSSFSVMRIVGGVPKCETIRHSCLQPHLSVYARIKVPVLCKNLLSVLIICCKLIVVPIWLSRGIGW